MEEQTQKYGPEPELLWLEPQTLAIDDAYQRSTKSRRGQKIIQSIVNNFDWKKFGALVVSENTEGNLLVVDGQHRAAAAMVLRLARVPACKFNSKSTAEEADAFVGINRNRTGINALQLFHAKLAAGDETSVRLDKAVRAAGVEILRSPRQADQMKSHQTAAVSCLKTLIEAGGEEHLSGVLGAIMRAYPTTSGLTDFLIRSVSLIAAHASFDVLEDEQFADVLASRSPDRWHAAAKAERETRRCPATVAGRLVISREFNNGRRGARLPMDW